MAEKELLLVWKKRTTAILEFYFRFRFWLHSRHRRVILPRSTKFRQNLTTHGKLVTSYPFKDGDRQRYWTPTKCNCGSQSLVLKFSLDQISSFMPDEHKTCPCDICRYFSPTAQIGCFGLRVGGHPALSLHSSNEPGELSQWLCHDDSTINIVIVIIIIIIIISAMRVDFCMRF